MRGMPVHNRLRYLDDTREVTANAKEVEGNVAGHGGGLLKHPPCINTAKKGPELRVLDEGKRCLYLRQRETIDGRPLVVRSRRHEDVSGHERDGLVRHLLGIEPIDHELSGSGCFGCAIEGEVKRDIMPQPQLRHTRPQFHSGSGRNRDGIVREEPATRPYESCGEGRLAVALWC
jgi:hypothetical protein